MTLRGQVADFPAGLTQAAELRVQGKIAEYQKQVAGLQEQVASIWRAAAGDGRIQAASRTGQFVKLEALMT